MFIPWQINRFGNEQAVRNARDAATSLSRARVEREEVELYLAEVAVRYAERHPA